MVKKGIRPELLIVLLIVVFFFIALGIRIILPYDSVFTGGWTKFTSNDAYYYMRIVDNLVHNFPHLNQFDPYFIYPGGAAVSGVHFFDLLMAVVIWIIGLGSPTQHTIDVVGVYFPTVLAALTVIPVFFIGKALFNRWVGVMAAFLMAVLPGEWLGRSILGFTEHHVAETLFSTVAVLFLILAIKNAGQKQLTFNHLIRGEWKIIVRPLVYSLLAGLFLGIYLITWMGALLFVFIIAVYFIIQFMVNHLKHKSSDHLGIIGFIVFLVALVIYLPFSTDRNVSAAMVAAVLIPLVLAGFSRLVSRLGLKTVYYPLSLIGAGIVFFGIFYAVDSVVVSRLWTYFVFVFAPGGSTAATTMEMQHFLYPEGTFNTVIPWGTFTTNFFMISPNLPLKSLWWFPGFAILPILILMWLWPKQRGDKKNSTLNLGLIITMLIAVVVLWFIAPPEWKQKFPGFAFISFLILLWQVIKQHGKDEHHSFFIIWTLIILVATLVQRRFAYYLVVNVALLSAYITWKFGLFVSQKKLASKTESAALMDYKQARNIGIPAGIILLVLSVFFGRYPYNHNPYIFFPVMLIGVASLLFGCWGWARALKQKETKKARNKNTPVEIRNTYIGSLNTIIAILVMFSYVSVWNITKSVETASKAPFAPSDGWEQSLDWLRNNTPDPLGDPGAYDKLYTDDYKYPASAYGVTAWWDYGYWISRTARRLPSANPSQDPAPIIKVANLFLSQNITSADKIMAELGSSYIIADYELTVGKLSAVVDWAGQNPNDYYGIYYVSNQGVYHQVTVFKPDYYRSLVVRLYNFEGKAVTGGKPVVVTYDEKVLNGITYKVVSDARDYPSYQAAKDYIAGQKSGKYDIVGADPFVSPIPLEAVQGYNLVYSSKYHIMFSDNTTEPQIKIFKQIK